MLLARSTTRPPAATRGQGMGAAFRQGLLTNVLNPKVALFYLAFLPQFVSPQGGHPQLALLVLVLGVSFIGTGLSWSLVLALLGGRIHRLLLARPRLSGWMDRFCGTVLLGFGLRLALQRQA
jgi:threonine/homoserine/homoserine lactone efflux protein